MKNTIPFNVFERDVFWVNEQSMKTQHFLMVLRESKIFSGQAALQAMPQPGKFKFALAQKYEKQNTF